MIIQNLPINIGRDADGNDIASTYATKSEIPKKVSDLTNDSGFITDVSGKADAATTLSGYGITDAYTKAQVDKKVSDLVSSAPETLDTLNELASALGNDPNFATTVANQIGTKANDSNVVHNSGDETISGTKTFSSQIVGSIDKAEKDKDGNVITSTYATKSEIPTKVSDLTNDSGFARSADLSKVATSGSYEDLSDKPTIPTVNNATLTIQKNGTTVKTFTANASSNVICNILVPTKVSDLTNDSGFVSDLSSYYTKSETDALLDGKSETTHNHNSLYLGITAKAESAKSADSVAWANVSGKPSSYTPSSHTHDDRYYTESEVDAKLGEKSNSDHTHSEYLTGITKAMVTNALGYTPPTSDTHWTTTLYAGAKDAKSNAVTTNGNAYIKLYDNNTVRSQLNIKGSGATTVTTDANGVITISSTDNNTTYGNMTAATADAAGTAGLVPAPAAGKQTSFLRGDGTWVVPTNTTYASMSAAEATTGTATTARSISAKVLNDKIDAKISALVASAPETLDTLNELASALGNDPNFATTVATQIGTKANANHNHDSVYVKLTGGTITNNINKVGIGCSWKDGRTNAIVKTNATSSPSNNQYVPCISAKSYQGSWELGTYTNNDYYLTYITDENFDAGTNKATTQYKFCSNGTLIATKFQGALVGNADTATKATNNASGNELSNDIIKGLSVSGKVITYTKLDGTTDTITTQDTNTTYSAMSAAEATTGTATTARSITAKVLNDKIDEKIATKANSSEVYHYGVCSTAAAVAAKVVSITDFVLKTGVTVFVKFTVNNTATNNTLTLNVNSTGAKKIYWRGAQTFNAGYIGGNRVIGFVYDGTNWEIIGELDTSTSVIQTVTATNATYPILMSDLANATANRTSGVRFGSGVKINPSTNTIYATTFSGDVDFPITEAEVDAIFS